MKMLLFPFIVLFLVSVTAVAGTEQNDLIIKGDNFIRKGDVEQSIYYYTLAILEDPSEVEAYLKRARAYIFQNNLHLAMEDYNKALEIDRNKVSSFLKNRKSSWMQYNDAFWQEE